VARLTKRQVEQMTTSYDIDPTAALLEALRIVLENSTIDWNNAVRKMPAHISVAALQHEEISALDQLLAHLIENRDLQQP
jgi:hypothetical protein